MKNAKWLVIGIFIISLMVRLPAFGQIPVGLNRDEAALGFNAVSILKTARDEYGVLLPTSITSFGDQKLPGYVYALIPFIAALGTDPWVLRLPSFIAGLAVIFLTGRLVWLTTGQFDRRRALPLSLLAMLFLAVSPWANHFSRVAYEAHVALAWFLTGLVASLEAVNHKKHQRWWLAASALGFSLAFATYHSYQILVPLTVLGLAWLYRQEVRKADRTGLIAATTIGLLTIFLLWQGGVWKANQTKFAGISPFSAEVIERRYFTYRQAIPGNTIVEKFVANRVTEQASIFVSHAIETLSSDFLFTTTTDHRVHNQSGIGNFHLFLAPLLLIGLAELWHKCREKSAQVLWLWLLAGIVAPSLTIAPQHTVRLSPIFPLLELISALGAMTMWASISSQVWKRVALAVGVGILALSVIRYDLQYLVLAPQRDAGHSHEKWHLLATSLGKYRESADELVTQSPSSSPYIWYVLLNQYDPTLFRQAVEYYPTDKEGFRHVRQVGKVTFETITWDDIFTRAKDHSILLFLRPTEFSLEPLDPRLTVKESIHNQAGEPMWYVVEVKS